MKLVEANVLFCKYQSKSIHYNIAVEIEKTKML